MRFSIGTFNIMKTLHGLTQLSEALPERFTDKQLVTMILQDLENCRLTIQGNVADQPVVLAELETLQDSVIYEPFDKRFDLLLQGRIVRDDCPPLTYCLQGKQLAISGRCSIIPRVCGVDLYLNHSYSGKKGDFVRQKLKLYLADVKHRMKNQR
jgi:hypothetical protein